MVTLKRSDLQSDTWKRLVAGLQERREALIGDLKSINLDHAHTMVTRGRLAEIEKLLALDKAPAKRPAPSDEDGSDE
jgi:hypothetical protein